MVKTKLEVASVYDGTMDATELFVSLIAEKIANMKQLNCRTILYK